MTVETILQNLSNFAYSNRELAIAFGVAAAVYLLLRPRQALKLFAVIAILLVALYFILQLWQSLSTGMKAKDTMIHGTERSLQ